MVSFSCESCNDVLTKKKLDAHFSRCRNASFTCIDCMQHFRGTSYKSHTKCMTEEQKYQGTLIREKKPKLQRKHSESTASDMAPHKAYVEDEGDADYHGTITIVEDPPPAPSPPPAGYRHRDTHSGQQTPVNVFDFLVDQSPTKPAHLKAMPAENGQHKAVRHARFASSTLPEGGFTYGEGPVPVSVYRFESDPALVSAMAAPATPTNTTSHAQPRAIEFTTPGMQPVYELREPRDKRTDKSGRSSQKRKRAQVEELDLSLIRSRDQNHLDAPSLHSGLTGGLQKLLARPASPSPASPMTPPKRSRHAPRPAERALKYIGSSTRSSYSDDESHRHRHHRSHRSLSPVVDAGPGRKLKAIEYRRTSLEPQPPAPRRSDAAAAAANGALTARHSHAEFFVNLVTKGPDSSKGQSVYTALREFHSYVGINSLVHREEKQLLKGLRMKRNKKGEVVLFARRAGDESP